MGGMGKSQTLVLSVMLLSSSVAKMSSFSVSFSPIVSRSAGKEWEVIALGTVSVDKHWIYHSLPLADGTENSRIC